MQPKRVAVSSNYSNVAGTPQNASSVRASSVPNAHFDYAEMVMDSNQATSADDDRFEFPEMAADSSDSTVDDSARWDTPFAQESLGNTVIHFDTV